MTTSFIERVKASTDAFTGLVAVANGAVQTVAGDLLGRAWVRAFGDTPHDTPDNTNAAGEANNPVKIGGYAADAAPTSVSASGDRVNGYFDRQGRQQVDFEKIIAGENPALNVLRVVRGKLTGAEEAWLYYDDQLNAPLQSWNLKALYGRLARMTLINNTGAQLFVLVIDNSSVTATATNIRYRAILPAGGMFEKDWCDEDGLYCTTGISIALSTALNALTTPGAGVNAFLHAAYR